MFGFCRNEYYDKIVVFGFCRIAIPFELTFLNDGATLKLMFGICRNEPCLVDTLISMYLANS